ncbi:MAG TPA: pyridoxal-dependent decarboxylase, partial [Cytophagales bacterium]|nr:pyridoxal-dependent decarboxylase [Cytophagales bacterium]
TWLNAPAASELEQRVIRWIVEFIGYDPEANGVLVSGGSLSNFTALRVAIAQKCPYHYAQVGFDKNRALRIYASEQAHFCIERAIGSLGLGMENLVKIRVDKHFRIDLQHLREHIEMDLSEGRIPLAVVGNAGTVNTGAVDPINELSAVCKAYGLWLHLDAAYGGFAASIPKRREQEFAGMDLADSITIDLHKWLFVPFECGALLMKNPNHLRDTFRMVPEYQRFDHEDSKVDFSEWSMQQSRSFKALKVWMNFKAYGAEPLRQSIRSSLEWMQSLGKMIEASNDFELITPVSLSVVCFRYRSPENDLDLTALNRLNKAIVEDSEQDERVFIRETTIRGQTVLRACCTNFRREKKHLQYLLAVLREFGRRNLHRLGI